MLESKELKGSLVRKEKKIVSLCEGKSVLHLGCADYPFGKEQYRNGNLLHQKIANITDDLIGVDLSTEGIAWLASLGYKNLLVGNVEKLNELEIKRQFEVIVAGELLEHLSNPGMFLSNVKSLMEDDGILIITVPNAHAIKSFVRVLLFRKELIHPDHVYYFSQATIEHLCKRYELKIKETFYYVTTPLNVTKRFIFLVPYVFMKYLSLYVGDGIIFIMEKNNA
ncbi:hypothetical protein CVT91_02235 [Candidatus Atribacteria bacterium HGW-Atribacteria-1]|nr:MAG: hypothetical protein CVT91_02235 [Candidatus Atribacteria bacterium HGW-Atribacteria-1]